MSLPPEVEVQATPERVLYRLPHRRLLGDRRRAVVCVLLGGGGAALLLFLYLWIAVELLSGKSLIGGLIGAAVASPMGFLGAFGLGLCVWLGVGGRSELLLTRSRLLLRERVGPLAFRRVVHPGRISLFRVYPLDAGKGALHMEIQGGSGRRWAVDYPIPLLEALAADLALRKDELLKGAPAGPADVEVLSDGLRVTARPTARRSWLVPAITLGLVVFTSLLGSLLGVVAERAREHLGPIGTVMGLIWAAGVLAGVHGLRICRRVTVFESTRKALKVVESDFLGRRVREWARADVWGFEVSGGLLQFRLSNGSRPVVLDGRDGPTLEWIAGILRRGTPRKDVEVLASTTSKGTCQVCATAMEERIVWCRRCRTPHHQECWVYTGMCSTFGCREIGFTEI